MYGIWKISNYLNIIFFQRKSARDVSVAAPASGESACYDD